MKSMGTVVMMECENGFVTLYSNLAEVEVGLGEVLAQGDVIGQVGESIARNKPAFLHFEIRRNGEPVDPIDYF
jgi:septal ring factor EnvC (AmiA/AmiB activator)